MVFGINMYICHIHLSWWLDGCGSIDVSAEISLGLQGRELSVLSPWMRSEYLDIKPLGGWWMLVVPGCTS